MASLVAPLVSGIRSAASGTAEFFIHGTSTLASVFSDVNATVPVTNHALDADGAVVRYVTQLVDVVVRNASGAVAREFTWVDDARLTRVENGYYTGAGANGQTTPGGRTTLDTILSTLGASFGDYDLTIPVDGQRFTLANSLPLAVRESRYTTSTVAGVAYTPDDRYAWHTVIHSSGASMAFANPSNPSGFYVTNNATLGIVYANNTGGNRTPTWGTRYSGAPATAVATGTVALYLYKNVSASGLTGEWVLVTTSPVTAAS